MVDTVEANRLVILHAPVNEQLRRTLNSRAAARGIKPRDLLHELLCVGLDCEELLPFSPKALDPGKKISVADDSDDTDDEPEQRQAG